MFRRSILKEFRSVDMQPYRTNYQSRASEIRDTPSLCAVLSESPTCNNTREDHSGDRKNENFLLSQQPLRCTVLTFTTTSGCKVAPEEWLSIHGQNDCSSSTRRPRRELPCTWHPVHGLFTDPVTHQSTRSLRILLICLLYRTLCDK